MFGIAEAMYGNTWDGWHPPCWCQRCPYCGRGGCPPWTNPPFYWYGCSAPFNSQTFVDAVIKADGQRLGEEAQKALDEMAEAASEQDLAEKARKETRAFEKWYATWIEAAGKEEVSGKLDSVETRELDSQEQQQR